jgi:hypothetical protein
MVDVFLALFAKDRVFWHLKFWFNYRVKVFPSRKMTPSGGESQRKGEDPGFKKYPYPWSSSMLYQRSIGLEPGQIRFLISPRQAEQCHKCYFTL